VESRLIIECNQCAQQVLIPTATSYEIKEFDELIKEPYSCPFCFQQLIITPKMWRLFFILANKMFHLKIMTKFFTISSSEFTLFIPSNIVINSVIKYIEQSGIKLKNAESYLPSVSDLRLINVFQSEYDHYKWTIKILSENVEKPI
jgi:hypothetical protein